MDSEEDKVVAESYDEVTNEESDTIVILDGDTSGLVATYDVFTGTDEEAATIGIAKVTPALDVYVAAKAAKESAYVDLQHADAVRADAAETYEAAEAVYKAAKAAVVEEERLAAQSQ